jgi:hypothetical protein
MPFYGCAPSAFGSARARYRTLIVSAFCMACAAFAGPRAAAAQDVDVSSATRLESVMASIRARDPKAAPGLAAGFASEPQAGIRAWILRGVAALAAPQGPALFQAGLQDPSPLVRLAAAEALAKTGGAAAVADLSAALAGEKNPGVRHTIVAELGSIKTAASAAALQQALSSDPDAVVRIEAARSLRRHGGAAKRSVKNAKNDGDARVRAIANEP